MPKVSKVIPYFEIKRYKDPDCIDNNSDGWTWMAAYVVLFSKMNVQRIIFMDFDIKTEDKAMLFDIDGVST